MDIIKTKHYGTPLDVIFDGRYIFKDAFHGIVAVAEPIRDDNYDVIGFNVEQTQAIEPSKVKQVIAKHRGGFSIPGNVNGLKLEFDIKKYVGSLPYGIRIELFE